MALEKIENKSFQEIKDEWDVLLAEVKSAPPEVVAERYLQSRMDAKQRDESLAVQGQEILAATNRATVAERRLASTTTELETAKLKIIEHTNEIKETVKPHVEAVKELTEQVAVLNTQLGELQQQLADEKAAHVRDVEAVKDACAGDINRLDVEVRRLQQQLAAPATT